MAKDAEGKGSPGSCWELPSGSWRIQYYADGKPRRETHPTEQAARARLAEIARLKAAHIRVADGQQTVTTFYTAWLAQRAKNPEKAARSLESDQRNVEGYILPAIGELPLASVRAERLQALLNDLQADIQQRTGYPGTRTAQLVASLLAQAFEKATRLRYIPYSPMDGVEIPGYTRAAVAPGNEAQAAAVLRAAADAAMPALWHAYALLGVRRGEALGWRWQDYDATSGTLAIAQQVQAIANVVQLVPPKSQASLRTLPVPPAMARLLSAHKVSQAAARLKRKAAYADHGLIFASADGGPLWPSSVNTWWYALRDAAGLPTTFKLHHLRHSLSTMVDEADGATEALKNGIFGHEAQNMNQHYSKARIAAMRRVLSQAWARIDAANEESEATG